MAFQPLNRRTRAKTVGQNKVTNTKRQKTKVNPRGLTTAGQLVAVLNDYRTDRKERAAQDKAKAQREWLTIIGLFVAAFIALFSLVELHKTTKATQDAASATRDAVRLADGTAKRQLRAYVFIKGGGILLKNNGKSVQAYVELENFGQTPGYDFQTWTNVNVSKPRAIPYLRIGQSKQRSIIGPGATFNAPSGDRAIDNLKLAAISAGEVAIFVWGAAAYRDAFGRCWELSFRIRATGNLSPQIDRQTKKVIGSGWGLSPDPRYGYSETEKDCPQQ